MLTSHAERNTGLWVGNATYLTENQRLTDGIIFKTFILRFTLRIHILKKASLIWSEKPSLCWGSLVPHPPLAILLQWLVCDLQAVTKIPPRPSNTQALQALNTQSGGSRSNTLTLSKTWCAGMAKLLWLSPTFPSPAEPEQLLQLLQQQTPPSAGSSRQSMGKAGSSLPEGKDLPRAELVWRLQYSSFRYQLCQKAFDAYGQCLSAWQFGGAVQGAPQVLGWRLLRYQCFPRAVWVTQERIHGYKWYPRECGLNSNAHSVLPSETPPFQKPLFLSSCWQCKRGDSTSLTVGCRL